jgi:hypothetical protein
MHLKEKSKITVIDHIKIWNPETGQVLVNQRGNPIIDITKKEEEKKEKKDD